jgi:polysaccharide biosynthesis/export protein
MLFARRSVSKALVRVCLLVLAFGIVAPHSVSSQQRVETTDETNSRIRDLARKLEPLAGSEYKIGGGDIINIEVFDIPQLTREVKVSESGYIALPLLPMRILAKGLTAPQLEEKLGELLRAKELVTNPQVTVTVKQQNSHPIMVIGAVRTPHVIQASRPMSLVEVLSACGGIADDAGEFVVVTKDAAAEATPAGSADGNDDLPIPQTISLNLISLLNNLDSKNNVILTGGETVSIPKAGIFYVVGAVNHPGGFVLSNNSNQMTTLMAVALAAGTQLTAKTSDAVILRKNPSTGKNQEIPVNLKLILQRKSEDTTLMANDILFVPDSTGKRAIRKIADIALTITTGVAISRAVP